MSKRRTPRLPLRMPNDTVAFENANNLLQTLGVRYERPSPHQLKIGRINYFANTGSIHVDGESKARRQRGREALKALILEEQARLDGYLEKRKAEAARRERDNGL